MEENREHDEKNTEPAADLPITDPFEVSFDLPQAELTTPQTEDVQDVQEVQEVRDPWETEPLPSEETVCTEAGEPQPQTEETDTKAPPPDGEESERTEQTEDVETLAAPSESGRRGKRGKRERGRAAAAALTAVRLALFSAGILGYVAVGLGLAESFDADELMEYAARSVFGGCERVVMPLPPREEEHKIPGTPPEEDGETAPPVTEQVQEDSPATVSADLSCSTPYTVFNETSYSLEGDITAASRPLWESGTPPSVLVIHSHGTEAYAERAEDYRSTDTEENVVAVGDAFSRTLESEGVTVYHCREMFDRDSYIDAYEKSGAAVSEYIRDHPDIDIVIDIHRDAVTDEEGRVVRSDCGGAQLMIVCGTDEMGATYPHWRENLSFAAEYQRILFEKREGLVRHINLKGPSFNGQLARCYIILEVGTCGNTVEEAQTAATAAAQALSEMLTDSLPQA